jgi:hypothetical protein
MKTYQKPDLQHFEFAVQAGFVQSDIFEDDSMKYENGGDAW